MGLLGFVPKLHKTNKYIAVSLTFGAISLLYGNPAYAVLTPDSSITFMAAPNIRATISIDGSNAIAATPNNTPQILVKNISSVPQYARDLWIDDFNFDGLLDVAITTHIDVSNQDQFYSIFTWEAGLQQFIPLTFGNQLSNLEIDSRRKEVRSSYKARGFWTEDTYRFGNRKQPYLYSRSELLSIDVWHTSTFNTKGQEIRSLVSMDGRLDSPPQPVTLKVSANRAPLYAEPLPSTRLPIDLSRGSSVTLVDFKHDSDNFHWVYIRSNQNNQPIQGWVQLSSLQASEDY